MGKAIALLAIVAAGIIGYALFFMTPVQAPDDSYSGTITFDVVGSDETGIVKVEVVLNNAVVSMQNVAATTSYSQNFTIDTTSFPDGDYVLFARAYDGYGNIGKSQSMTLTFRNGQGNVSTGTTNVGTLYF